MRINQFVARASGISRRAADKAIAAGRITVNDQTAQLGQEVLPKDSIKLDNKILGPTESTVTIMLNKPAGYVVSRTGQGSKTVYDLIPDEFSSLKPVGRLDKDSSGLLLLTNDGQLAQTLTHPKFVKQKVYEIELNKDLALADKIKIEQGVNLDDGLSRLKLAGQGKKWTVKMTEGRNRQIRRTFAELGYSVTKLHRTEFGSFRLNKLELGLYTNPKPQNLRPWVE